VVLIGSSMGLRISEISEIGDGTMLVDAWVRVRPPGRLGGVFRRTRWAPSTFSYLSSYPLGVYL